MNIGQVSNTSQKNELANPKSATACLAHLNEISQALILASSKEELYQIVIDSVPQLICAERIELVVRRSATDDMERIVADVLMDDAAVEKQWSYHMTEIPALAAGGTGPNETNLRNRDHVINQNLATNEEMSVLSMPLIAGNADLGRLTVTSTQSNQYTDLDTLLLTQVSSVLAPMVMNHQLLDEQHQANLIVEKSPAVLLRWRAEPSQPIEYVSENISQFGFSAEAFLNGQLMLSEVIHPNDYERLDEEIRQGIRSGTQEFLQTFRFRTISNEYRWIENRVYVDYDEKQRANFFQGIAIDITEQKHAQEMLRQQSELQHMIEFSINSAPQAIFWLSRYGDILNANDGACRMLGYTREEFLAMNVVTIDPTYYPSNSDVWRGFQQEGMRIRESILRASNGSMIPAEVHLSYLAYNGQEYQFAFVQDITERQKMEAQARRQLQEDELLREILILTTGPDDFASTMGKICQAMAHFYDIPRSGFALLNDDATSAEVIAEYVEGGRVSSVGRTIPIKGNPSAEYVLASRDVFVVRNAQKDSGVSPIHAMMQELGTVSMFIVPIFILDEIVGTIAFDAGKSWTFMDDDIELAKKVSGQIGQALHRIRMMEELVATGEALRKSEEQLKEVLGSLPSPISIARKDGSFLYVNDSFGQMLGTTAKYVIQQLCVQDLYIRTNDRLDLLQELVRDDQLADYKVHLQKIDGTPFWASTSVYSLKYDGEPALLSSVYDLSEQMRTEQILRDAKEAAETANQTKSLFLSNMTHELRTPMNGVLGMTSLLLETELEDEQREIVDTIRSSGDTLLTVINDILDFSKIEANKLELELVSFELSSAIEETTQLVKPTVDAKDLSLHCMIDTQVPAWILQDVTRLRQILTNLLSNAVKFTAEGEVRIHVTIYDLGCNTSEQIPNKSGVRADPATRFPSQSQSISQKGLETIILHFAIADTGIGIPEERLFRLFQPFSQIDATTTRRYGGTGLGLVISKQLCELMGGEMWVESEVGVGTTFHFTIRTMPAHSPYEDQSRNESTRNNKTKEFEPDMAALYPLTILLAEDNVVNQKVALGILSRLGYRADVAANGMEVLDALRRQRYDAVLMDIQMPEMDGLTATKRIRVEWPSTEQPAIIAVTAHATKQDQDEYLAAGMDDYVSKPIRIPDLSNALKRIAMTTEG
ncbi:MAG: PAS domain S-box protein [Chloroflexota bacterium]